MVRTSEADSGRDSRFESSCTMNGGSIPSTCLFNTKNVTYYKKEMNLRKLKKIALPGNVYTIIGTNTAFIPLGGFKRTANGLSPNSVQ